VEFWNLRDITAYMEFTYIQDVPGEYARIREIVPWVKVHRFNEKHLYPKLNGYGDNGETSLKVWQLLHTYWLPNTH